MPELLGARTLICFNVQIFTAFFRRERFFTITPSFRRRIVRESMPRLLEHQYCMRFVGAIEVRSNCSPEVVRASRTRTSTTIRFDGQEILDHAMMVVGLPIHHFAKVESSLVFVL